MSKTPHDTAPLLAQHIAEHGDWDALKRGGIICLFPPGIPVTSEQFKRAWAIAREIHAADEVEAQQGRFDA